MKKIRSIARLDVLYSHSSGTYAEKMWIKIIAIELQSRVLAAGLWVENLRTSMGSPGSRRFWGSGIGLRKIFVTVSSLHLES